MKNGRAIFVVIASMEGRDRLINNVQDHKNAFLDSEISEEQYDLMIKIMNIVNDCDAMGDKLLKYSKVLKSLADSQKELNLATPTTQRREYDN